MPFTYTRKYSQATQIPFTLTTYGITDMATGAPTGLIDPTGRYVYRYPQVKQSGVAQGATQANLERYLQPGDRNPVLNAHVPIVP